MKKLLYSVAVIIAMLCTACENFDHAIADQNDRLDVLEQSTIKNIDEQVESINASLKKLEAVDAELKALIEALKSEDDQDQNDELIAQLEAKDAELEKKIADLKAYIEDELSKSKDWANATFATLEQYTDIQEEISSLSALIDQHKTDMSEAITEAVENAVTSLETSISALETSMKKWVNEILAEGYYDIAAIDAKLEALEKKLAGADDALAKEIKDQAAALEQAKKDLTAAYEKAIADAIQTNNGVISKEIADAVQKVMDQVEAKLADIANDIAAIKKDIESIKGSIASIEEQIAAIEKSLTDLKAVDQNLQKLIDDLQTALKNLESNAGSSEDLEAITDLIDALELKDAELDKKIADLESYVKTELANSKDWANATFTTLEQYGAMQKEMSDLKALINTYKSDVTADYTQAIKDAISASETGMNTWVNEALVGYYKTAEVDAILSALETKLSGADSELSKKIEDQKTALETAKSDLTTAYKEAIATAISDYDGQIQSVLTTINEALTDLQTAIATINEEIKDIKDRLGIVEEAVEDLVARIQSMRFIPEFSDGKVALGLGERTAELTFMISPRDAAAGVAAAWASSNDVVTAFIKPTQPRTKASYDMEALAVTNVTGNANGTLVVTISTEDLSEDFWYEGIEVNVFVCISDGNNDIISEMIPIYYVGVPYVTFKASAAQTLKIDMDVNGMQFSTDKGATWHSLTASTANATFGPDNDLLLRGINSRGTDNATISFTDGSVPVACSGDIRTLVDYRNYANVDTGSAMFTFLFWQCTVLTSAPELPATTLARYCYSNMFDGCTGLTKAPSLPATQLADYCYSHMFSGCTGLTSAPELPATTLAEDCYYSMFNGCTGLTTAPALPATTLAKECYYSMFNDCTGLTTAPALPATKLEVTCYKSMFSGCIGLTTAPELPATRLSETCYSYMFYGCTGLTSAPVLPAATLTTGCYQAMFNGCSSLNEITMLATNVSASRCLNEWVSGVAATGTFTKVAEVTLTTGVSGIPAGWTVIQEASKGVEAPDFGFGGSFSN